MYDKLDEVIMEVCKELIERNKSIFASYNLESKAEARTLVYKTQRLYESRFGEEPSKMTIWRHIHKLAEDKKLTLEERPPITLKVMYVKIKKVKE